MEYREEHAGIQVEVNQRKRSQLDTGTEMPPSIIMSWVLVVVDRNLSDDIFCPLHCIKSVPPAVTDRLYYITISRAMINHNARALTSGVFC